MVIFPLRSWVEYRDARNVNAKTIDIFDFFFEHPAYVRANDEKMRLKIMAHRETEPITDDWHNKVWMKWTPEFINFHPTNPEMWEAVISVDEKELPQEMVSVYLQWNKHKTDK